MNVWNALPKPRPNQGKMEQGKGESWEEFSAPVRSWASKLFFCLGKVKINKFFFFYSAHLSLMQTKNFFVTFFLAKKFQQHVQNHTALIFLEE